MRTNGAFDYLGRLFCPRLIADAQRRKSAPLVPNFAWETRTDLCISHADVLRRIGLSGCSRGDGDGPVTIGAVASRMFWEGGSGEHDAAVRRGIRVCSRWCDPPRVREAWMRF